jgi:hypothetical protein
MKRPKSRGGNLRAGRGTRLAMCFGQRRALGGFPAVKSASRKDITPTLISLAIRNLEPETTASI